MKKSYSIIIALLVSTVSIQAQVDYDTEIQPILTNNCSSCHSAGQNGFTSTSYNDVINSTGTNYGQDLVVPGDADASGLVDKIEPTPQFGTQMPQGGSLTNDEISLIRRWIDEGANAQATNTEEFTNPEEFRLLGNYPNPFNPSTQIQFTTPVSTQYSIQVYTVHGQLISEQTGNASAGLARVNLNMGQNPTGVYIYRVTAIVNSNRLLIGSGRMTLIK